MKNPFVIRQFDPADAQAIQDVARASWHYTYNQIYSAEKIDQRVDKWYAIEGIEYLVGPIEQGLTGFWVLDDRRAGKLAGFVQIGYQQFWDENETNETLELFRIYLHPDYIGKGLGEKLLTKAEQFVIDAGHSSYVLKVHVDNQIGRAFYDKHDFEKITTTGDEFLLRKQL